MIKIIFKIKIYIKIKSGLDTPNLEKQILEFTTNKNSKL